MDAARRLKFLSRIQRLLGEGEFVATYKFALLQAIADLCVENEEPEVGELLIPLDALAEKFVEYYWQQSLPFGVIEDEPVVLKQNSGRQAAIINAIAAYRSDSGRATPGSAGNDDPGWRRLRSGVARTVKDMPLWKLQVIGREVDAFIYRQNHLEQGSIRLLPGIQSSFRAFHGLITHLVQGAWLQKVRALNASNGLLGDQGDLGAFLFGSRRGNLERYRAIIRDFQDRRCFYCGKDVRGEGHADHFIPWSRYPMDLGHNFVFADAGCNSRKRDFLPAERHLDRWLEHLDRNGASLDREFSLAGLSYDQPRSLHVAYWAYEQGESSEAHTWVESQRIESLAPTWRDGFSRLGHVAETPADYE